MQGQSIAAAHRPVISQRSLARGQSERAGISKIIVPSGQTAGIDRVIVLECTPARAIELRQAQDVPTRRANRKVAKNVAQRIAPMIELIGDETVAHLKRPIVTWRDGRRRGPTGWREPNCTADIYDRRKWAPISRSESICVVIRSRPLGNGHPLRRRQTGDVLE